MSNGKKLPTISVGWDQEKQTVQVEFKNDEFLTWDMVIAALRMAVDDAEFKRDVTRQQRLMHAHMEVQQNAALRQQILR